MPEASPPIDKVRASRDGHEFHEAWTARKAMQLLLPDSDLVGIAVEGLEPNDQAHVSTEAAEVADLTLYYGQNSTFKNATKIQIVQFKYSIGKRDEDFRAADAKKTITKFAAAYNDHIKSYGVKEVYEKLEFELITNRPISPAFKTAIQEISHGTALLSDTASQACQFKTASDLDGAALKDFARRFLITGSSESLSATKTGLSRMLVDWSAASDAFAGARLGELKQVVRDKAGYAGTNKNVIRRADIIAALRIGDVDDLLPCPAGLADVGTIVEREQLKDALALIPQLCQPLLIHSAGGVGKTVFMKSLAEALKDEYEIVFFDCFGGGAYRSPEDARHLPKMGLIHTANSLAVNGLCDPILPGSDDIESLFRTFRRRLEQCVGTLSGASRAKGLLLFIDAIDNAAEQARDRSDPSFPTLLVQTLRAKPVSGLKLILSSRSHRIPIADHAYYDFELKPFTFPETETYLRPRLTGVKEVEIRVAHARSGGNARILEYLLKGERGLLDPSEIDNRIELDDLIRARIDRALALAADHGYRAEDTDAFLAGLAVLPPPVPLDEYAQAHGMSLSAIESFASDLWPLLERTKHGLMFRDEPTETLVRQRYASCDAMLRRVAGNLVARQDRSVYAARALPGLLQKLGDGAQLFDLAFDIRLPATITSTVGKRNIRYARLKAAVRHAASEQDHDRLVHLLVELSTITAVDQRGTGYILRSPDLVTAAQDVDATRRLFETRTAWQGTRHARLCIANTLSGDADEASRHAVRIDEWLRHYCQKEHNSGLNEPGPESLDTASIPFFSCTQGRFREAAKFMSHWKQWYAYEVDEHVFRLLRYAEIALSRPLIDAYLDSLPVGISGPVAALSILDVDDVRAKQLVEKVLKACRRCAKLEFHESYGRERLYDFSDAIRKAAAIALLLNTPADAVAISRRAPHERPSIWSFRDHFSERRVFPFLFHTALTAAAKGTEVHAKDIIPKDLAGIVKGMKNDLDIAAFRSKVKKRLEKYLRVKKVDSGIETASISYEQKREAERFLEEQLEPLLILIRALTVLLLAPAGEADTSFRTLLDAWAKTGSRREHYGTEELSPFFQTLGRQMATFGLAYRRDLTPVSAEAFLKLLHEQKFIGPSCFIDVVSILARRKPLENLAGEEAMKARRFIDSESDVTYRANLYVELARAILPASPVEAVAYFRVGLEQIDAIGSGDYEFTNELLLFASSLKGKELEESSFHMLTNICELNLPEESEKFPWIAFGKGLSRGAGCRGLAKLGRWDDRVKAPLECTLLPYLTALLEDDKIAPEDALALNRLADPVEFFDCNTGTLSAVIDSKRHANEQALVAELIDQFKGNSNGVPTSSSAETLAAIAKRVLGVRSKAASYLSTAHSQFSAMRDGLNENTNYHGKSDPVLSGSTYAVKRQGKAELQTIVSSTDPCNEVSLTRAVDEVERIDRSYELRKAFFDALRGKVPFAKRAEYIRIVSVLENLNIYLKLDELQKCNEAWGASSAVLKDVFEAAGILMVKLHAEEMVSHGRLSGYVLKQVSELSSLTISALSLELVKLYAEPDSSVPAAVWLGLATFACCEAREGEGQAALTRLLNSDAAKLSSSVTDGPWKPGLYPENDATTIFSGLVWRRLGSPAAADRWRAAHSIRCFAKFERWGVIDALVGKLRQKHSQPYQAPELPFYFMHAKLWMIVALARVALDDPKAIAKYTNDLLTIINNEDEPHVLMRHFAAKAILACVDAGTCKLPKATITLLRKIDQSRHPRLRERLRNGDDFYRGRPPEAPKRESDFHLDYDFHKYDVQRLSGVFGKAGWEVHDLISDIVRSIDPNVTSMYESGGRERSARSRLGGMTSRYHTYGQQLGWHALFLAAGRLLHDSPVTDDRYYDDPWEEWLSSYLLTRKDGLWLSDGMDWVPIGVRGVLLEKGEKGLVLTGDKSKILRLVGLDEGIKEEVIVEGRRPSADQIKVRISSVFIKSGSAPAVIKHLIQKEPFFVWLPTLSIDDEGQDYLQGHGHSEGVERDYIPWITLPSAEGKLDNDDPLGLIDAVRRPRITGRFASELALHADDPFERLWKDENNRLIAHSNVWGSISEESDQSGICLSCSSVALQKLLTNADVDLILLIKLERYEGEYSHDPGKYTYSLAITQITKALDVEYHAGSINHLHKMKY